MMKCPKCDLWMISDYVDTAGVHYRCPSCNYRVPEDVHTHATTGTSYSMREATPEETKLIADYIKSISVGVAPVVHAHWTRKRTLSHDGELYCSNCEWSPEDFGGYTIGDLELMDIYFCPHCGAKMDEEVDDG